MNRGTDESEELRLILDCQAGSRAAFESLYRMRAPRAKAYFLRCGFSPADADDMVQDAFTRLLTSIGRFDPQRGAFAAYMATIIRNVARKRWARRTHAQDMDSELAQDVLQDTGQSPSPEQREEAAAVGECVSRLRVDLAALVRLRYVEGYTTRKIAEMTGMAEATVRLRLDEAKALLEQCLRAKGVVE